MSLQMTYWTSILFLIVSITTSLVSCKSSNDTQYEKKPPKLYQMDDFYNCTSPENFCWAALRLSPILPFDDFYKILEQSSHSHAQLNHTMLVRILCIPPEYKENSEKKRYIENRVNEEMRVYNLTGEMYRITCYKPEVPKRNIYWPVMFLVSYLSFITFATIYERSFLGNRKQRSNKLEQFVKCFSLFNYEEISVGNKPDYNRLKSMQGFRSIQAIFVIFGHVLLNQSMKPLSNPEFLEYVVSFTILEYVIFLLFIVLSTFFMYSNWLLTNFILNLHKQNGKFSFRDAVLLFLSRIYRTWPLLYIMIFILYPLYLHFGYGPGSFAVGNLIQEGCDKNWFMTFLLATNFVKTDESCHLGMWSLSIDTQFFLFTILFWYVVLKFNLDIKKSMFGMFGFAFVVSAAIAYVHETQVEEWINLKQVIDMNFFRDQKLHHIYYGFWVNLPSSLIGMIFGYLYFKSNDEKAPKVEPYEKYYKTIFYTIPPIVLYAAHLNYTRLETAFAVPLLRIFFNMSIAVGIYGLSRRVIQGMPQKIFENKYLVMLGDSTFCTYLFHFFFVFIKENRSTELSEISILKFALVSLQDVIVCFFIGIVTTILFAVPTNYLKKFVLPSPMKAKGETNGSIKHKDI